MNKLFLSFVLVLISSWTSLNSIHISGKVTDENGTALAGVNVALQGSKTRTLTDTYGEYHIEVPSEQSVLVFSFIGYVTQKIKVLKKNPLNISLKPDLKSLQEVMVVGYGNGKTTASNSSAAPLKFRGKNSGVISSPSLHHSQPQSEFYYDAEDIQHNTEGYNFIRDNSFHETQKNPLSTFSIDVDKASYSNVRRFIDKGQMPPKDAVRIEEMINYFTYNYPQPKGEDPFSINTELAWCPWNPEHKLVSIGLQGKNIPAQDLPASNLVFLIDVSGSMASYEKLPLVKSGFRLLVDQLREKDNVSIVVYAGAAGMVLEPTSGSNKVKILEALENLEAGGSTAGGAGINLAYKIAKENFKVGGNNRVILATDGDFNVGVSSDAEMERLISEKKESGIFLSVFGFGMGNYKDSKMEILADKGNGNYAYIDNFLEAKKVFVNEFGGTLFTIAKDVKLQIEFNPSRVKAYRLIGYENRILEDEDFNDDKKDAGDLGSGHTVTALYEIIPSDSKNSTDYIRPIDDLKYQSIENTIATNSQELMNIKFRYKTPEGLKSKLIQQAIQDQPLPFDQCSNNLRFAASVASFGMLLRDSGFKGNSNYNDVVNWSKSSMGEDNEGYRSEFLKLVKTVALLTSK